MFTALRTAIAVTPAPCSTRSIAISPPLFPRPTSTRSPAYDSPLMYSALWVIAPVNDEAALLARDLTHTLAEVRLDAEAVSVELEIDDNLIARRVPR